MNDSFCLIECIASIRTEIACSHAYFSKWRRRRCGKFVFVTCTIYSQECVHATYLLWAEIVTIYNVYPIVSFIKTERLFYLACAFSPSPETLYQVCTTNKLSRKEIWYWNNEKKYVARTSLFPPRNVYYQIKLKRKLSSTPLKIKIIFL